MPSNRLRAVFMRGGTSRAIMFRAEDLPADRTHWNAIFLAAMGSPDPSGRQLDGMGGGVSSLSKVCVVGPSTRADADVDYTFAQVAVGEAHVDYSGNCGNMSSAVGPFAIEEGIIHAPSRDEASVRIHNTNTGKIIVARFPLHNGVLAADGDMEIDGVAGHAAPIRLEFLEPGGAKTGKLLPTGAPVDDLSGIAASCVDAANPCAFVAAEALGKVGVELPDDLDGDVRFLEAMESVRRHASVQMGLTPDLDAAARIASVPLVAMVSAPQIACTLSGRQIARSDADLHVRMLSMRQPHRAVPITGAICTAIAARVAGSIPHRFCAAKSGPIRIGHASGVTVVDAAVSGMHAEFGAVYRTARRLFEGSVLYRTQ